MYSSHRSHDIRLREARRWHDKAQSTHRRSEDAAYLFMDLDRVGLAPKREADDVPTAAEIRREEEVPRPEVESDRKEGEGEREQGLPVLTNSCDPGCWCRAIGRLAGVVHVVFPRSLTGRAIAANEEYRQMSEEVNRENSDEGIRAYGGAARTRSSGRHGSSRLCLPIAVRATIYSPRRQTR